MTFRAGDTHRLRLEFFYNGGQGVTRLRWTTPAGVASSTKTAIPSAVLTPGLGTSSGLRGEYFKGTDLTERLGERIDAVVDFAWGNKPPLGPEPTATTALQIAVPEGTWQAEWVDTTSGTVVARDRVTGGAVRALRAPSFDEDIALRLVRQ
jgi:hypothetical protein